MPKPKEHETLTIGKFTVHRHDYDGEYLSVVWGYLPGTENQGAKQKRIHARDLEVFIQLALSSHGTNP